MLTGGQEVIIGAVSDPVFGKLVAFGLGGVLVEVLKDITFRLAPATQEDAMSMLDGIAAAEILKGVRGAEPVNRDALAKMIQNVSKLVADFPEIAFHPGWIPFSFKGAAVAQHLPKARKVPQGRLRFSPISIARGIKCDVYSTTIKTHHLGSNSISSWPECSRRVISRIFRQFSSRLMSFIWPKRSSQRRLSHRSVSRPSESMKSTFSKSTTKSTIESSRTNACAMFTPTLGEDA